MKIRENGKLVDYAVRDSNCQKKKNKCFVPFSGNGQKICRLYEIGRCPEKEKNVINKL